MCTVNYSLARVVWYVGHSFPDWPDINQLCRELAGGDWRQLRDDTIQALRAISTHVSPMPGTEEGICGYCRLDGDPCYWWHHRTVTMWSCCRPDWWPTLEEARNDQQATS